MTVEEFKKLKPEYEGIEGEELWNAMENYMVEKQSQNPALPIWKTHTLRWLFYRKVPNYVLSTFKEDKYQSDKRCKSCKWGVNNRISYMFREDDGTTKVYTYCPHCTKEYIAEDNTNITHYLYKLKKFFVNLFWVFLDKIRLVRSSDSGRYDLFGDESRYVSSWEINLTKDTATFTHKKRKWWEHILIVKPKK